jgi:hypothetical protein
MQPIPRKPAHRRIHLRLPQHLPLLHNPGKEPGQQQPQRCLRLDARTADSRTQANPYLLTQPGQVQHSVDPSQDMDLGHENTEWTADEDNLTPAALITYH